MRGKNNNKQIGGVAGLGQNNNMMPAKNDRNSKKKNSKKKIKKNQNKRIE